MSSMSDPNSTESKPSRQTGSKSNDEEVLHQLAENLRRTTGVSGELADTLAHSWKKFAGGVLAAILIFVVFRQFQEAQQQKKFEAAAAFASMQRLFNEAYPTSEPEDAAKKPEKTQADAGNKVKGIHDSLAALRARFPGSVYVNLGELYQAITDYKQGNSAVALEKLKSLGALSFAGVTTVKKFEPLTADLLIKDLSALVYGRILLGDDKTRADGRKILLELSRGGEIANGEALLSLYRTANSTAEREEVMSAVQSLIAVRPELADEISKEFKNLGASL